MSIRSVTEFIPDDFPTLSPLPEPSASTSSFGLMGISWQTWIIIILLLALLGINVFAYLAKGTEETASFAGQLLRPLLEVFGYTAIATTKQTIDTTATGAKAGVDIAAGTLTGTIDTIQEVVTPTGNQAASSLPVQHSIQQGGSSSERWQQDSLSKALGDAKHNRNDAQVMPDDSRSSIQITGKSGWCFIGEDQGIRTCSEIGVNDVCMSGDIFPNQAICMNPNLRA